MSSEAATAVQTERAPRSDHGLLRPRVGVKIAPVRGRRNEPHAKEKFAERLAVRPESRIDREQRIERLDDAFVLEILGIEFREPGAVDGAAEVKVVAPGAFADQADLGEVRPRAAVGTAGHADDDVLLREPM